MGKLGDHLANERLALQQVARNEEFARERSLRNIHYLYDATGTPPEQLLGTGDVLLAHEFIDITARDNHSHATEINLAELRITEYSGLLKWITGNDKSKHKQRPIWNGKGFYIGRTSGASTYLCTDGKLRCERTGVMFPQSGISIINGPSWVKGYGIIPPEYTDLDTGVLKYNDDTKDFGYYHHSMPLESVMKLYLEKTL